jgi:transcription initiation factor TFIIF subunit alpha
VRAVSFCISRYKGVKEATMVQNAAYYIFTQADDGSFEAHPVDAQYRFTPVINYRTLTADEAEEEFSLRNKTINYFSLMVKKRLTDTEEKNGDEEIVIPKVKPKVDKLVRHSVLFQSAFLKQR